MFEYFNDFDAKINGFTVSFENVTPCAFRGSETYWDTQKLKSEDMEFYACALIDEGIF